MGLQAHAVWELGFRFPRRVPLDLHEVAVKDLNLSCYDGGTTLITIIPIMVTKFKVLNSKPVQLLERSAHAVTNWMQSLRSRR